MRACDKYAEELLWGSEDRFHSVENNGNKFELFDKVVICTTKKESVNGTISFIYNNSIDISFSNGRTRRIHFDQISSMEAKKSLF